MCTLNIETGGYKLKNGKYVTPDNVELLTPDEIEELISTNISAWEFLMLRKSNHNLVNAINVMTGNIQKRIDVVEDANEGIFGSLKRIEDSLTVEIQNGETHTKKLGDVVVELWNLHKDERKRKQFVKSLDQYKYPIIWMLVVALVVSIKFHDQVNVLLQNMEDWVFVASTSTVFVMVIGYLAKN